MTKTLKTTAICLSAFVLTFGIVGFVIRDPKPDLIQKKLYPKDSFSLQKIESNRTNKGSFKTKAFISVPITTGSEKQFYGMDIQIADNETIDRISIGITNNLISRIEIWKEDRLIEAKEIGFVGKMTIGGTQNFEVNFQSINDKKPFRKPEVQMRLYEGSGFFGDIGTICLDLSKYGYLEGDKTLEFFSKTIEGKQQSSISFSNLQIWKDFESAD